MLKFKTIYLAILLICSTTTLLAQIQIRGTVVDKSKRAPLEFAHVFFLNQQHIGAISNEAGQFSLAIPSHLMEDTLVVTQLGYQHFYLPIKSIGRNRKNVLITLTSSTILLSEATVIAEGGLRQIVQRAIDRISQNYPQEKHRLKAFYREYSILNSTYSHFVESFVTIQDQGYANLIEPDIFVHEFRSNNDGRDRLASMLTKARKNELWEAYQLGNIIRSQQFNYIAKNTEGFLQNSKFKYVGAFINGSDTLIRISYQDNSYLNRFDENSKRTWRDSTLFMIRGELTINKTDYAILKHRYGFDRVDIFQEIQYQKTNNIYYPSLILGMSKLNVSDSGKAYTWLTLYHIYDIKATAKDFGSLGSHKKVVKEKRLEDMRYEYHPNFWDNNTIMLEVPANTALERDKARKEALKKQFEENTKRVKKR